MDARQKIDGWENAVSREQRLRDHAFALPFDNIGNIRVRHMSVRDVAIFASLRSRMLSDPFPSVDSFKRNAVVIRDAIDFAAMMDYDYDIDDRKRFAKMKKEAGRMAVNLLHSELQRFIEDTFLDTYSTKQAKKVDRYYSSTAGLIDLLAGEYGWNEGEILELPFRRALQYIRTITKRHNPKEPMNNPSDKLVFDYLAQKNKVVSK